MREVALCERWTDDLLDTDLLKLNVSIFLFCVKLGIHGLNVHRPFANLLNLSTSLINDFRVEVSNSTFFLIYQL